MPSFVLGSAVVRVTVTGELDSATAPRRDDALRHAGADADLVVLDLRRLEFMDCTGASALIAADGRARCRRRLVVVRGPPEIERLFGERRRRRVGPIGVDRRRRPRLDRVVANPRRLGAHA